jgi:hypothetical protein
MNESQRFDFDRSIAFVTRHMGDEVARHLRVGMDYYRGVEVEHAALSVDHAKMKQEIAVLKAQQTTANAPTEQLPVVEGVCKGVHGRCRKNDLCENWEPEPQTPGEGMVKKESALVRDEDKHPTDKLDTVEKKSFISRLFGG